MTFIIAEAGVNHNGSLELAKKLVDVASEANCDAIKFQTFITENLMIKNSPKAEYQIKNDKSATAYEMIKNLELSKEDTIKIKNYCDKKNILFLSTPFDIESAEFLNSLNMQIFKIPSGEITNLPLLEKINSFKKEVILSTGMANLEEIQNALNILKDIPKITLLHCTTDYPCSLEDVNMNAMLTIKEKFNLPVGYSDHTVGTEIPVMAVSMGATVIEKHFTLDKNMDGPDHKASLNPQELLNMVKAVRNIEKAFGNGEKIPQKNEIKNIEVARKSIVAKTSIKKGEKFTENNLTTKRPATGISPMKWYDIIGTVANKDYEQDEVIIEKNI